MKLVTENSRESEALQKKWPTHFSNLNKTEVEKSLLEPATLLLLGSGLIGVGVFIRRKFKK